MLFGKSLLLHSISCTGSLTFNFLQISYNQSTEMEIAATGGLSVNKSVHRCTDFLCTTLLFLLELNRPGSDNGPPWVTGPSHLTDGIARISKRIRLTLATYDDDNHICGFMYESGEY